MRALQAPLAAAAAAAAAMAGQSHPNPAGSPAERGPGVAPVTSASSSPAAAMAGQANPYSHRNPVNPGDRGLGGAVASYAPSLAAAAFGGSPGVELPMREGGGPEAMRIMLGGAQSAAPALGGAGEHEFARVGARQTPRRELPSVVMPKR